MPFPYIFTFYSYKGGVGRSLALLNTAYDLVSRGRHVLIIDMDLEAPGLSGFLLRHGELLPSPGHRPQDILSLLSLALDAARRNASATDLPPISNFLRSVRPENLSSLDPKFGKLGRLDVVGAEQNDHYLDRLTNLGLKDLDQSGIVEVSTLLSRYCKAQRFPFHPLGFEEPHPPVDTPYDYVLIDSRTGFTEVGGLCVGPWADRLVVITGLNDQNVIGTKDFLRVVGLSDRDTQSAQAWDDADPTIRPLAGQPTLGPKPTILVASPVPLGETEQTRARLNILQSELKIAPLSLSYHPLMALLERVFVRDYPDEFLTAGYQKLTSAVLRLVDDHPEQLTRAALDQPSDDSSEGLALALRAAASSDESARSLLPVLADKVTARTPESMVQQLFSAWSKGAADRATVLQKWGNALGTLGGSKTGEAAITILNKAQEKYQESTTIDPSSPRTFTSWGRLLINLASHRFGAKAEAVGLLVSAEEKFAAAAQLRPDWAEAFSEWGVAIYLRATLSPAVEAEDLYKKAIEKLQLALENNPRDVQASYHLGTLLTHLADTGPKEKALPLLYEAAECFARVVELQPKYPEAQLRWGSALASQSAQSPEPQAGQLREEAIRKYRSAFEIGDPIKLLSAEPLRSETAALQAEGIYHAAANEPDPKRRLQLAGAIGIILTEFPSPQIALQQAKALYSATVVEPDPSRRAALANSISVLFHRFPSQQIALQQAKALCNATAGEPDPNRCVQIAESIGLLLNQFPYQEIALQQAMALHNTATAELDPNRRAQLADAIGFLCRKFPSQEIAQIQAHTLFNATVAESDPNRRAKLADAIGQLLSQYPSQKIALAQAKALVNATAGELDPIRRAERADSIGLILNQFPSEEIAKEQAKALANTSHREPNPARRAQLADTIGFLVNQFPSQMMALAQAQAIADTTAVEPDLKRRAQLAYSIGVLLRQFPSQEIALQQALALYYATDGESDPDQYAQLADAIGQLLRQFPSKDIARLFLRTLRSELAPTKDAKTKDEIREKAMAVSKAFELPL